MGVFNHLAVGRIFAGAADWKVLVGRDVVKNFATSVVCC